ncbi:hypothetical protein MYU51_020185 [Penicillium brevicompactum]|uniref:Rhodopsin domain-containing protein n=1 Tax=Penicillium brevicompactum TaxID=5074 RepID=A0A9W9Q5W5_PENBR|nr:uncharacterized protein N7506_003974 [Penicillium brevicompactum]KAJ5327716.1 hypothetical protein N7452_008106 [Penicillium brevicompactum]KAJ5335952.1 hypothetical protein N7506_003974 [Penicillium brevicompactum]
MGLHEKFPAYGGRGPSDLRLGIALGVVATIFMVLRVYVRLRMNKFGTSALIWSLVAWLFTTLTQIFGIISVLHGLGNHITIVEEVGELHNFLLFTWITVFFFNLAIPTGKVAVAAFLIEMNSQSNPKIRRSLIIVAGLNIVFNIPQILLVWFQCSPPSALWDPLRQAQCDHGRSVYYTYFVGAVAAISDFYLAIIPITMLIPLRIDKKLKWGLSFLMGCGVFAGAAAIVRTWAAKFIMSADSSYGVGVLFRWGEVEEWIVLITMSIPPVWPIFRPLTHRFIKSTNNRSQPQYKLYNEYGQFASTTRATQSVAPPIVTTTISISSMKGRQQSADTVDASSCGSLSRFGEDEPETPHTILSHNGDPEGWVEMKHFKEPPRT